MTWHVRVTAETKSGSAADETKIDRAGGRMAIFGPSMSFDPQGPRISVTIAVEAGGPGIAFQDALGIILRAFESVGEPLTFQSGSVYTVAEFERESVRQAVGAR